MSSDQRTAVKKMSRKEIFEAVRSIVAEHSTSDAEEIRAEQHLTNDLGCDSLDVVEITMELEEHFDIAVPDEVAESSPTVGAIVDGIERLLNQQEQHAISCQNLGSAENRANIPDKSKSVSL